MAIGLAVALEKALLDAAFGAVAFTATSPVFLAALTTMPTDGSGAGLVEVTNAGSYARLSVTNNATNFSAATGTTSASKVTALLQDFVAATASWGTVIGVGVSKVSTIGDNTAANWLAFIPCGAGVAIASGNVLELSAGAALTLT